VLTLQVRYFASLREALGPGETVHLPEGSTVADLRQALVLRGGAHAQALAPARVLRAAVAQVMCDQSVVLRNGQEVAFFPPVTGG
jgi:sulfur-carrier protein